MGTMTTQRWMTGIGLATVALMVAPSAAALNTNPLWVEQCELGANAGVTPYASAGRCCKYVPSADAYACYDHFDVEPRRRG
jgi:hypothetical protein